MTATRVLVLGLRATGAAVAAFASGRGDVVTVVEDRLDPADPAQRALVGAVVAGGGRVVPAPDDWDALLASGVDLVVPSPGVRPDHPVHAAAARAGVPVRSEIDVAAEHLTAPLVAVTGTNGKTTITELITAMLERSGRTVACGGNIGTPLISLVGRPADVVVAEVSSFQLDLTTAAFRPAVAVLANIDDDHLDWHGSRSAYEAAKAKVFAHQGPADVLVFDATDDAVVRVVVAAGSRRIGVAGGDGPDLVLDDARHLLARAELPRDLPHDRTNSLLAAEAALAAGADLDAVRAVLREYRTLPHRVALVARADGIEWYDDSKATNPHATRRAVGAFDSVVLAAGGLNKGLDLGVLALDVDRIRAVIAFGAAAPEVVAAFTGLRPVEVASDMDDLVARARRLAEPGDAVLLSPACASFDAYRDYGARGDDFARAVRAALATVEEPS